MFRRLTITPLLVAIAFLTVLAHPTLAAPRDMISQQIDCSKAVSTPELKYCAEQSYKAADKRLNQVYQKVISTLSSEPKQKLIDAQLAWIEFRDNNCSFETYGSRDGTAYQIFWSGCLERLTKQRTTDLEEYLSR
jgi:uncharacterized protein YecT (DUF1311 family)